MTSSNNKEQLQKENNLFLTVTFRTLTVSLLLFFVVFVLFGCKHKEGRVSEEGVRPDIVLISIDSLRADHLGCYGYRRQTSPVIDRIASEGVSFENAFSTTSWTLPAHGALFTGLYDSAHGVVTTKQRLSEAHLTLAEVLLEEGYQTAGFYGGPYLHPAFGLDQGFETYQSCMTELPDDAEDENVRKNLRKHSRRSHVDITGPRTVEKFSSWLGTVSEKPLFAFLHMWDVHYDYIPPEKYIEMFDPEYKGKIDSSNFMQNDQINPFMSKRDMEHIIALYDGEIRFTDDMIGNILGVLQSHGRLNNTLIVIFSDHGDEFFEHGGKGHQRTLYDELIKIPLIFYWPGHFPEGKTIKQQAQIVDIMPTILDLVGIPLTRAVQGRSLVDNLSGSKMSARPTFCELLVNKPYQRVIRTSNIKILVNERTGQWVYFDLLKDPGERRPITRMNKEVHRNLEELEKIVKESHSLRKRFIGENEQQSELNKDIEQRLRSLGYTDGQDDN